MAKLDELRAAFEASSEGRWYVGGGRTGGLTVADIGPGVSVHTTGDTHDPEDDATFIALAHALMPELLECAEALIEIRNRLGWANPVTSIAVDALAKLEEAK